MQLFNVSPHFSRTPYFTIYDFSKEDVRKVKIIEYPHAIGEHGSRKGQLGEEAEGVIVYGIAPRAFYRLSEAGVKVFAVDKAILLEEALKLLKKGRLREVEEPVEQDKHHQKVVGKC